MGDKMITKKKVIKNIALTVFSAVIFYAVTMPFRRLFQVISVTEVRPAAAINPVSGLIFGFCGALGCAFGNLAADIMSGYSPLMCALGFVVQLIYGLLPYSIWKVFKSSVRLDSSKNILRYMVVTVVNSAAAAFLLGLIMLIAGIGKVFSMATLMIFFNNFVFGIVLGIPIILVHTKIRLQKIGENFSLNERFIIIFLFLSILSAAMMGFLAFGEISVYVNDLLALWNRVYICISIDLVVFSVIIVCILHYAEKNITIPLERLSYISGKYYKSEDKCGLNTKLIAEECIKYKDVHGEAGKLAKAFGEMAVNIEKYIDNITKITAENERIGAELNVAAQIQTDMLPSIFPAFPERNEFDIFAEMFPAKEVGGDFYDFFLVDNDRLAMVMADVSGKGVPAALFMVIAKTLIKNRALMGDSPAEILKNVNEQLCEGNKSELFVTVWLAVIEISTGKGKAANAGHEHPALRRSDGKYELITYRHSPAVATIEGIRFREHDFEMKLGDSLFVYTDGVPEATNQDNELYGTERMLEALNSEPAAEPERLLENVKKSIDEFVGKAPQFDDLTMLGFTYHGNGGS